MKYFAFTVLFSLSAVTAHAQWTNGQSATYVVGQTGFNLSTATITSTGLSSPAAVAIDALHSKMYIADCGNHRVLRYVYPLAGNTPVADRVFGQVDFTTGSSNGGVSASAHSLSFPYDVKVYNGDLWVADYGNNRVVRYAAAWNAPSDGPNADIVLGQLNMTTVTAGFTDQIMSRPQALAFDGSGNLWVADNSNNRVLRFTTLTTGSSADKVLGQTNFTNHANLGATQSSLTGPAGIAVSGTTLWVAEQYNSRVLRFDNAASKSNGGLADGVIGQPNFTTNTALSASNKVHAPRQIAIDGSGRLYVVDYSTHRIAIFNNAAAKVTDSAMDNVLGQTLTTGTATGKSDKQLNYPNGVTVDNANGKLFVAELTNNRVVQYSSSSSPLPVELSFFHATTAAAGAELVWQTASETNNYGFEIERTTTTGHPEQANAPIYDPVGKGDWNKIGFVEGNGTTNAPKSYSFVDKSASGKKSYRLKQIDRDGKFEYSQTVEVTALIAPKEFALEQNYPNPFNPTTAISYQLSVNGCTTLKIYDAIGREVATLVNEVKEAGYYSAQFDGAKLSSGIYFAKLTSDRKMQMRKLLLMK